MAGDLRALLWADLLQRAEAGDRAPLADALRTAEPADVPRAVLVFVAGVLATGKRPRARPGNKPRTDAEVVRFAYLAGRAAGMPHVEALSHVMDCCHVERSTVYRLIHHTDRATGDRLAQHDRQGRQPPRADKAA